MRETTRNGADASSHLIHPRLARSGEIVVWLAAAAWLAAIGSAFYAWERYDATPGKLGPVSDDRVGVDPAGWQLTLFAHPICPCTRSSLELLPPLMRACPQLCVRVLFVRPVGASPGWEYGDSWDLAAGLPGVDVGCDADGVAAGAAGAETSGTAVLTDPTGRVTFRGGLTPGRGRAGEGAGVRAVTGWVTGVAAPSTTPVFGCPLHAPFE